jgi:hypothetical protein
MCKTGIEATPINWFSVKGGLLFRKTFFTKRFKKEQIIDMIHPISTRFEIAFLQILRWRASLIAWRLGLTGFNT